MLSCDWRARLRLLVFALTDHTPHPKEFCFWFFWPGYVDAIEFTQYCTRGLRARASVYEPWMGLQIADARVSPATRNDIVLAHNLKSNDVRTLPALFLPHGT